MDELIDCILQRWAWQHPNMSKKVSEHLRVGSPRRKSRPSTSLVSRLTYLDILLRTPAFARWPLTLRFFASDVYAKWNKHNQKEKEPLPSVIKIVLDEVIPDEKDKPDEVSSSQPPPKKRKSKWAATGNGGVQGLDITSSYFDFHLQKSTSVIEAAGDDLICDICQGKASDDDAVICSHAFCQQTTHLTCLAGVFTKQEGGNHILPVEGKCPSCQSTSSWGDIVRELNLRTTEKLKNSKKQTSKSNQKNTKPAADTTTDGEASDLDREHESERVALGLADQSSGSSDDEMDSGLDGKDYRSEPEFMF